MKDEIRKGYDAFEYLFLSPCPLHADTINDIPPTCLFHPFSDPKSDGGGKESHKIYKLDI